MKDFAFLISAYTEPESLANLVKKLNGLDCDIYIHIDKKTDIARFHDQIRNYNNVTFINNRTIVHWGGYSQVQLQINMIEAMLQSNIRYKRVVNLTGTDYPIKNLNIIKKVLVENEIEFIIGFDVNNEKSPSKRKGAMINKYKYFHFLDTADILRKLFNHLPIPNIYFYRFHENIYFGSEYWALTYDCVKDIYQRYLNNKPLQKLLMYSYVPSEAWVHTVFFNSPLWKDKAIQKPLNEYHGLITLSPITWFYYSDHIKILNSADCEVLKNSNKLFARKIIVGKSDDLINQLDLL